ncbi:uncharacterized protein LOC131594385 [Vicia villosa]|uniref:uncharacterized protein LOC131594385 n=1 Tax=Vicia villosa TaxID=3911 RepID=UPI00273C889A|nr:uncharacterized protein LOC131594385 [Vicia villosa]
MNTILLRNISYHARRIRLSYPYKSSPSILSLSQPTSFFSSRSDTDPPPYIPSTHDNKQQKPLDIEEISNEELKRRVARLKEGDDDAIPAVFEAVLQRYLTGKPIDADQDLMREILGKGTVAKDDDEEDEDEFDSDSDLEGTSETDFEEEEDLNLGVKSKIGANEGKTKVK